MQTAFETLIIGIGGMIFLMVLWIVVQSAWRKMFRDQISDDDVLAGRSSCTHCGCTTFCERRHDADKHEIIHNQV